MSSTTTSTTVPPAGLQSFPRASTIATRSLLEDKKNDNNHPISIPIGTHDAAQGNYAQATAAAGQAQPGNPTTGAMPVGQTAQEQQDPDASAKSGFARQQSWSMQDHKHETLKRDVLDSAPRHQGQNYSSTAKS
jgi:hypothetical protein